LAADVDLVHLEQFAGPELVRARALDEVAADLVVGGPSITIGGSLQLRDDVGAEPLVLQLILELAGPHRGRQEEQGERDEDAILHMRPPP
jgi:hypothetical protein